MTTNAPTRYGQPLSGREAEILRLVASGQRNAEIGRQLHLTEYTVKTHLQRLSRKLGARSRTHAVAIALRQGVLTLRDVRPAVPAAPRQLLEVAE